MVFRHGTLVALCIALGAACSADKPKEAKKTSPLVVLKPLQQALAPAEREELGFPPEIIAQLEQAAGSPVIPFYETVLAPSENLKGDMMITRQRLAGISVQTKKPEKIIIALAGPLRSQGFLIFRSEQNYGTLPDVVTVIRGASQYDILTVQRTEAPNYNLDTKAIIKWLKAEHKNHPFVITGAGPDWVEARFVKVPKDARQFAYEVYSFAPDVVHQGSGSVGRLSDQIEKSNSFYLWWD